MHAGLGDGLERAVIDAVLREIGGGDGRRREAAAAHPVRRLSAGGENAKDTTVAPDVVPPSDAPRVPGPTDAVGRRGAMSKGERIRLGLFRESTGELRHGPAVLPRGGDGILAAAGGAPEVVERRVPSSCGLPPAMADPMVEIRDAGDRGRFVPPAALVSSNGEGDDARPSFRHPSYDPSHGDAVGAVSFGEPGAGGGGRTWSDLAPWSRRSSPVACDALVVLRRPRSAPWYSATFEGAVHDLMIDLWARDDILGRLAEGISMMLDEADLPLARGALLSLAFTGLAEFDEAVRLARAWPAGLGALGLGEPWTLLADPVAHRRLFFVAETLDD